MKPPAVLDEDDPFTELADARIDRVDLVGNAANGTTFLLAKSALNPKKEAAAMKAAPAVSRLRPVRKAKSDPQVAVYDQNGNLVGVVDPDKITMLADPTATDLTPAPSAEVGTPADGVAKLKKAVYLGLDPVEQNDAFTHLNRAAITGLDIIQGRRAS